MSKKLERELEIALLDASKEAVDMLGYYPRNFLEMLTDKGARQTAEELMTRPKITYGLEVLWEKGRLDLSIEAIVLENPYKGLFLEETLEVARKSLRDLNYNYEEYASRESNTQGWEDEELAAAVGAYFEMLQMEIDGLGFNKSEVNRSLMVGALHKRNRASIEWRMQNISSVLHDMGVRWITGYKPAANVGPRVFEQIKKIIFEKGYLDGEQFQSTSSPDELEKRTLQLRRAKILGRPSGTKNPIKTQSTSTAYKRDPAIRASILNEANGNCESCKQKGPFVTTDGYYFLEVHHVKLLADGGSDTVNNAVALCPNCHRAFHFSVKSKALVSELYDSVERLIRE